MHFNPYGGLAAELAAELVNAGRDLSPSRLLDLLREFDYKPLGAVSAEQAATLTGWARRLDEVFGEPDIDRQTDLVNALLADAAAQPYISRHDGRPPHLHFANEHDPVDRRLRAYTAAGLAHAVCQDGGRLGRCDRHDCAIVYVDTSRNGRRRFCSTRCANRVHVADHRSRHTIGTTPGDVAGPTA
ncbi:CGNR zinc finger domain-containing protein [Solihabitans fulvus]|uniref:CGNR zinc finger domain-containing protein n=1 Tax=Solihabitans fulvus TaxID=1892852 RepID=A0A5B2XQM1_9PSEU|nr:CGNR zinc finger domain-containing protein [Solihabitans fulvus]KAA2265723.1 CGNR zinc finger domain-containing protein [Solihabitans fulvus]